MHNRTTNSCDITLKDDAEAVDRLVVEVNECIDPCLRRLLSLP